MKTDDIRTCMRVAREHGINCGGALDDFAAYGGAVIELSALEADNALILKDNYHLRAMLAFRCAGPTLYGDDGELQDCSTLPHIDFKNDSPSEISAKLIQRANSKLIDEQAITSKPLDTTNHCPLCEGYAVHVAELEADNARKDGVLRYVITLGTGVGQLTHAIAHAEAALTGSPAGAFVTLEDLRKIEWADENEIAGIEHCYCPACHGLEQDGHRADCWLAAKIKEAEDGS